MEGARRATGISPRDISPTTPNTSNDPEIRLRYFVVVYFIVASIPGTISPFRL